MMHFHFNSMHTYRLGYHMHENLNRLPSIYSSAPRTRPPLSPSSPEASNVRIRRLWRAGELPLGTWEQPRKIRTESFSVMSQAKRPSGYLKLWISIFHFLLELALDAREWKCRRDFQRRRVRRRSITCPKSLAPCQTRSARSSRGCAVRLGDRYHGSIDLVLAVAENVCTYMAV